MVLAPTSQEKRGSKMETPREKDSASMALQTASGNKEGGIGKVETRKAPASACERVVVSVVTTKLNFLGSCIWNLGLFGAKDSEG